jgi:hypothetical protein
MINFAKEKVANYNPMAGYGYYEFTERNYVLPSRNIVALKKVTCHMIVTTVLFANGRIHGSYSQDLAFVSLLVLLEIMMIL